MRSIEGIGNLDGEIEQFFGLERLASNPVLECLSLQKLHRNEGLALVITNLINCADIRVVQRGGCLSFTLETLQSLAVPGEPLGQEFERDEAMQPGVLGLVNHAHAPAAEFLQNAIVADSTADHGRNLLSGRC